MKTRNTYLVIAILLLGSLVGNRVYAQYTPGPKLPCLDWPSDKDFDMPVSNKGFVRLVATNPNIPMYRRSYSIFIGDWQDERFRVSADGTVSIITPHTYPYGTIPAASLNFYQNGGTEHECFGSISCNQNKMAITGANGVVTVSDAITMKIGRNGAPTIKGETADKWLRIGGWNGIAFWGNRNMDDEDKPHVLIKETGMTIGQVTNPKFALNVSGSIYAESDGIQTYFGKDTDHDDAWIGTISKNGLYLGTNGKSSLYFDVDNNNTYIGLRDTDVAQIRQELKKKYSLFVAKGVLSEDYGIGPRSTWSDFVFNKDYALRTIPEVEEFISENNHLPDVPSAKQVAEEGYSQHDMNKILLQKIEELTLYTIQQQKEIQELKTELTNLKK